MLIQLQWDVKFRATFGASQWGCLHDRTHFLLICQGFFISFPVPHVGGIFIVLDIVMRLAVMTRIDPLIWKVAAALFTAQLCPHDIEGYVPALSEVSCWSLVLACLVALPWFRNDIWKDIISHLIIQSPLLWWTTAASMAATTFSFSFEDGAWIYPIVTATLIALRRATILPCLHQSQADSLRSRWFPVGAIVSVLILAPALSRDKLAWAGLAFLGLVGTYGSLIRTFEVDNEHVNGEPRLDMLSVIRAITYRTIGVLFVIVSALMLLASSQTSISVAQSLAVGATKAAHWMSMFSLIQDMPWETATAIWTFAAASQASFSTTFGELLGLLQIFARILVAFFALYHTITLIPKTARGRSLLYVFVLWPAVSPLTHATLRKQLPASPEGIWTPPTSGVNPQPSRHHPIEELILEAQVKLVDLVDGQSKTREDATKEYLRRYSREPPPGFDKWFAYAKSKESVLIDDFDMIDDDLKPFWQISPQRLLESIDHVSSIESLALRKCGFANGQYHGQGGGWIVDDLGKLLNEVAKDIPDVEFAFDVVDEPRVVIARRMLEVGGVEKPEFLDESHHSIWPRITASCQDTPSPRYEPSVYDYGIPFVQDWYHAKDVCQHADFGTMHGFFSSPATCLLTDAPIPVLSQAAPTTFGDIMYPSPWYQEKVDQGNYKDEEDPVWEHKADTLYWAGSTTGSYSTNGSWKYSHRQRFVKMVERLNETNHKYLKETDSGKWESYEAADDHQDLFSVKLTAIIQCDEDDCNEQKEYFGIAEKEERSQQFQSRFVFDADGNSFSGRYYTLLRSRSVVLKQTVLKEWHDERLIPWVHFIPVSLSMDELPEIMRYMTSHEEGRRRAKEIADQSRAWHKMALRREDFTIYLYRLMLELARIMDPERKVEKVG